MNRIEDLKDAMRSHGRLVVLFSGGLDSALLARLAHDALGDHTAALTIDSAVLPRSEMSMARRLAEEIGIRHYVLRLNELEQEHFKANPPDRCYSCRKVRDAAAWRWVEGHAFESIADGLNYSDLADYRPGLRAATEDHIWHPFIEMKVTKDEIRELSQELGLSGWDRPSMACLASRFPHGCAVLPQQVERVDLAEEYLRGLGFIQVRVRHFPYELAVVEVDDPVKAVTMKDQIVARLRELGFAFVSLDLERFSTGKLNRTLESE